MVGCPRELCAGLAGWIVRYRFHIRDTWEGLLPEAGRAVHHPSVHESPDAWVIGWDQAEAYSGAGRAAWQQVRPRAATVLLVRPGSSARSRLSLLEQGADDCLALPVFLPELLARLRLAVIRRRQAAGALTFDPGARVLEHGHLRVDPERAQAWWHDRPVPVSAREADLLALLVEHGGACVSHRQVRLRLMDGGAGRSSTPDIDSAMSALRGKLARAGCGGCLQVVAQQGLRLSTEACARPFTSLQPT